MVTGEETRALQEITTLAQEQRKRLLLWGTTVGLVNPALPDREDASKRDPLLLLKTILEDKEAGLWVLRDFHPFLKDAGVVRRLREIAFTLGASAKTVILLGPVLKIPPELEKEVTVVDFDLPTAAQLQSVVDGIIAKLNESRRVAPDLDRRQRAQLVQACLGLTESEAGNALAKAIVQAGGALGGQAVEAVTAEKKQIIRKSGLLEYYDNTELIDNVGGLGILKEWLRKRVRAFTDDARAFGLPAPKGILLVGVQGCGKSLIARSVANMWRLPLLRLDAGRLFSSLVGSSEENLRQAIKTAESIAPAILWVDEIEKGFAGVGSSNVSDAGTAARVFGSFITWLQEKQKPVFVVATANDISKLPPEFSRAERFDGVFFLDLPEATQRQAIWQIYIAKYGLDASQAMPTDVAWTGAEIKACCRLAALLDVPLIAAAQNIVPVSRTSAESVEKLRTWASGRCLSADRPGLYQGVTAASTTRRKVTRDPSQN